MVTATKPSTAVNVPWSVPAATRAPTTVIPEMALDPDIRGVCSVGGTLVISSTPRNTASAKRVTATSRSTASARCDRRDGVGVGAVAECGSHTGMHGGAAVRDEHGRDDLVIGTDVDLAAGREMLQEGDQVP